MERPTTCPFHGLLGGLGLESRPSTGLTFVKHDATSLTCKYIQTYVALHLCLTCMSVCHLLQDGCSSFDIALELGKKIKSLQVATCGASSEKDKKPDFMSSGNEVVFVLRPFL